VIDVNRSCPVLFLFLCLFLFLFRSHKLLHDIFCSTTDIRSCGFSSNCCSYIRMDRGGGHGRDASWSDATRFFGKMATERKA
jgi:hypothetical protein